LHQRYVAAQQAEDGPGGVLAADDPRRAAMEQLHTELHWWWLLVKCEYDLGGWRQQLRARPLAQDAAFSSAILRDVHAESKRVVWARGLTQRATMLRSALEAAVTVCEGAMGTLPTAAELRRVWQADDLSLQGRSRLSTEIPHTEAEIASWLPAGMASPCRVELCSAQGLSALRAQIVPRLLRTLHDVLAETARQTGEAEFLRASLDTAELLADDRFRLHACFDKEGLWQMLKLFRHSALEMLGAANTD